MAKTPEQLIIASDHKRLVAESLALARESLGKGQKAFAAKYGITPNRWNQWEAGIYYPDPYVLVQICRDYGFTMDWFYRQAMAGVSDERADDLRRVAGGKPAAAQPARNLKV